MVSMVEYFGHNKGSDCGYCKGVHCSQSHGMWAHRLTCDDYQRLIDRGWRRSGMYCYKSDMKKTCCPLYTIRCEALKFQMGKSHRRVIKRVNKFLLDGIRSDLKPNELEAVGMSDVEAKMSTTGPTALDMSKSKNLSETAKATVVPTVESKPKRNVKPGVGPDPTKPPCMKAKDRRKLKILEKFTDPTADIEAAMPTGAAKSSVILQPEPKSLEELIEPPIVNAKHKLQIRLVRSTPVSKEFEESFAESHHVYQKYQVAVHKDEPDDASEKQFRRFLCSSPLEEDEGPSADHPGYGSFHQQYLIDGRIVAVGVIDILPLCVSSKYFYYDPDFSFLSLGCYSALQEMALVRRLYLASSQLRFYYMGFYVHSCPKMRYKAQYHPSHLLCPEMYSWHPVEICLVKLNESKYSRLSELPDGAVEEGVKDLDVGKVRILFANRLCKYSQYRSMKGKSTSYTDDSSVVTEYAQLVGKDCAYRIALYRD